MKNIFFAICFLFSLSASAQSSDTVRILPKNAIYFELLGNTGLASINYERMFRQKNTWRIAGRIGLGTVPYVSIPTELLFLKGRKNHFLEMGVGFTANFAVNREEISTSTFRAKPFYVYPMLRLGYRYQSEKGFIFRAGLLGAFNMTSKRYIPFPWLGFSFGKNF